ncbi:hypothetical protein A4A49_29236 [Nicotiana attenuata]|uniref:Uncharacterized protein n=1 Tax=Nicotiana attenuata TaxID=49451 RepID=A0A1J6K0W0_NICAT|nr:hypothetical protein A4A49_29236 [Nicotiana attenuata]
MPVEHEEEVLFMPANNALPPPDHPLAMQHDNHSATVVEEPTEQTEPEPPTIDNHEAFATDNTPTSQHDEDPADADKPVETPDTSLQEDESIVKEPTTTEVVAENSRGKRITKPPIWLKIM